MTYQYSAVSPSAALHIYHNPCIKASRVRHKTKIKVHTLIIDFSKMFYMFIILWQRQSTVRVQSFDHSRELLFLQLQCEGFPFLWKVKRQPRLVIWIGHKPLILSTKSLLGSGEDNHIWAWQPSRSVDRNHLTYMHFVLSTQDDSIWNVVAIRPLVLSQMSNKNVDRFFMTLYLYTVSG